MKKLNTFAFLLIMLLMACGDDDSGTSSGLDKQTIAEMVARHNHYRNLVGVADIEWSTALAKSAQSWANQLSGDCQLVHSTSDFGENLWMGTTGFFTPNDVVDSWAAEQADYDYDTNTCEEGEVCGHYTQVVWSNSTKVGCARITCNDFDLWVCQYDPPGNVIGQKPY